MFDVTQPFFRRDGEHYLPTECAEGPWARNSLHGRVLAGLIMHAVERDHLEEDFQVARVTVDLFKLAQIAPLTIVTHEVRSGNRIKVVDASVVAGEGEIARSSVVMLRRTEAPPGSIWQPPAIEMPHPDTLPERERMSDKAVNHMRPMWSTRLTHDTLEVVEQKGTWIRETRPFVDDEAGSPLVRVAMAADFVSPTSTVGDEGGQYINADITLYLHRDPIGEWTGMMATGYHAAAGVAIGECGMYDLEGLFGRAVVCALANKQRAS